MWNFFGDTDDITFGGNARSFSPSKKEISSRTPESERPQHSSVRKPFQKSDRTAFPHQKKPTPSFERNVSPFVPPSSTPLHESLGDLIRAMKPTYLPPTAPDIMRIIALSKVSCEDPLFLVRSGEVTLMLGTGYGITEVANTSYPTFPDMRLVESEKDRLAGWILLNPGFDVALFQVVLEMLSFPFVYGTRDVIAYIRDNVKDQAFLDKCRFFELFSPGLDTRKIADFTLRESPFWLSLNIAWKSYIHALDISESSLKSEQRALSRNSQTYLFPLEWIEFIEGEILDIVGTKIVKNTLKFTFDTFYIDQKSIGVVAGYVLKDREELAKNGFLTFVLEEDPRARAIVGHIFIDSRWFVHSHEMMSVHKHVLKAIRHVYESTVLREPHIERWDLVQTLRRELTKFCYLITGRTPVVMPIIIER